MKNPVPLSENDIDEGVEIVAEHDSANFSERGYLQWFFHSKETQLPVRDITDTQGEGNKPEPCIERKAENYCDRCYPGNVGAFGNRHDRRYMFLYTNCKYSDLDEYYGNRYIIGYIEKQRVLDINGRTSVQGPIKLVSFDDACPLAEVAPPNLRGGKKLDRQKTDRVFDFLGDADNIYQECVEKVEELESTVSRPRLWEKDSGVPPPPSQDGSDETSKGC